MSNGTKYFLVLFIIFLASCDARPIDLPDKVPAKDFQFSTENNEKSGFARVSIPAKVEPSLSNKSEAAENGSSFVQKAVQEDKRTTATKMPAAKFHLKGQWPKASGPVVSWKLPQKKRGEKQPGFNLDYAPPKTHPPSHN
jgi:hypothetical protein